MRMAWYRIPLWHVTIKRAFNHSNVAVSMFARSLRQALGSACTTERPSSCLSQLHSWQCAISQAQTWQLVEEHGLRASKVHV